MLAVGRQISDGMLLGKDGLRPCLRSLCFLQVLDLLEDACEGLLQHIKEHHLSAAHVT